MFKNNSLAQYNHLSKCAVRLVTPGFIIVSYPLLLSVYPCTFSNSWPRSRRISSTNIASFNAPTNAAISASQVDNGMNLSFRKNQTIAPFCHLIKPPPYGSIVAPPNDESAHISGIQFPLPGNHRASIFLNDNSSIDLQICIMTTQLRIYDAQLCISEFGSFVD